MSFFWFWSTCMDAIVYWCSNLAFIKIIINLKREPKGKFPDYMGLIMKWAIDLHWTFELALSRWIFISSARILGALEGKDNVAHPFWNLWILGSLRTKETLWFLCWYVTQHVSQFWLACSYLITRLLNLVEWTN